MQEQDRLWDVPANPSLSLQLHIFRVMISSITAKLFIFATESCPSHTPQVPRHAIWALLSHLLSFQPWDTLDKKKRRWTLLMPESQQEWRQLVCAQGLG